MENFSFSKLSGADAVTRVFACAVLQSWQINCEYAVMSSLENPALNQGNFIFFSS
jgi:hypothetical protein